MEDKKMYLVYYGQGDYDSYFETNLFVTDSLDKAKKYCDKFNRILDEIKDRHVAADNDFIKGFIEDRPEWFRTEFIDIHECRYTEIEFRK